jgi:hypothetical protein
MADWSNGAFHVHYGMEQRLRIVVIRRKLPEASSKLENLSER